MKIRLKRIVCFVFTVLIVMSSACMENVKAGYVSEYQEKDPSDYIIGTFGREVSTGESCTIEMLGIRNTSCTLRAQRRIEQVRLDVRLAGDIDIPDTVSSGSFIFSRYLYTVICNVPYYNIQILNYIHSLDGKK